MCCSTVGAAALARYPAVLLCLLLQQHYILLQCELLLQVLPLLSAYLCLCSPIAQSLQYMTSPVHLL